MSTNAHGSPGAGNPPATSPGNGAPHDLPAPGPWWWRGHSRHYVLVWMGLLGALFASLGIGTVQAGAAGLVGAILLIAVVKAVLVVGQFMHLAHEPRFLKLLVAGVTCVLLALYVGLFPDVVAQVPDAGGSSHGGPAAVAVVSPSRPSDGKLLYQQSCSACHGMDARGLPNLGKDLTASEFCKGKSDAELVEFVKKGRMPDDPANTTKIMMPPKGGNPALTDGDLLAIVGHVRGLQGASR